MASRKPTTPPKARAPARATGKGAKPPARGRDTPVKKQASKRANASKPAGGDQTVDKGGRPPIHSPELATKLCEHLMAGDTLREACARKGMPSLSTVMRWLHDDTGGFRQQYARAREVQAELDLDDTVRLADTVLHAVKRTVKGKGKNRQVEEVFGDAVERSRLMVDARKWRAAKMAPKKYGSLLDNANNAGGLPLVLVNDFSGRKQQAEQPGPEGAA